MKLYVFLYSYGSCKCGISGYTYLIMTYGMHDLTIIPFLYPENYVRCIKLGCNHLISRHNGLDSGNLRHFHTGSCRIMSEGHRLKITGGLTNITLRPRQNGRHFPDDIFKCIFLIENVWISVTMSLKFVSRGPISNIPTLVQVMAWHRPGDKPLSEPLMVRLPTHICVTRPQWDIVS